MRRSIVSIIDPVIVSAPERSSVPELGAFRRGVAQALADGAREVRVELDAAHMLDSPLIASLIAVLRDAREHRAAVTLVAGRSQIIDTLRVTGLDKVFSLESPGETGMQRKPRAGRLVA